MGTVMLKEEKEKEYTERKKGRQERTWACKPREESFERQGLSPMSKTHSRES